MKKFYIVIIIALLAAVAAYLFEPTGWVACLMAVFLASFVMMHYAMRSILAVSYRKKLYDMPDKRRLHKTPTPRLGGLAFAPILCCTAILTLALHAVVSPAWHTPVDDCATLVCSLIFIYMVGTIDDLIGVRYVVKFVAQIVAALLVVAAGFWINDLYGLFGIHALPAAVGIPLTVVFIVFIINAFNLIDGMDGLASGLGILTLGIYAAHAFAAGQYLFAVIAVAALGTLTPFFYTNVWGYGPRRRKMFMGDTGSQTLGLVVGVLAVGQIMNPGGGMAVKDLVLVLSPLLIPAFDVVHVMVSRMLRGRNPFRPDMSHVHHRLLQRGLNARSTLIFIMSTAVFYILMNTLLALYLNITLVLVADVVVWCMFNHKRWLFAGHAGVHDFRRARMGREHKRF